MANSDEIDYAAAPQPKPGEPATDEITATPDQIKRMAREFRRIGISVSYEDIRYRKENGIVEEYREIANDRLVIDNEVLGRFIEIDPDAYIMVYRRADPRPYESLGTPSTSFDINAVQLLARGISPEQVQRQRANNKTGLPGLS